MSRPRVFPDTGVLLALIAFPRDKDGHPTLAGEAMDLYAARAFELVLSRVVVDELDEIIDRDFPEARPRVMGLMAPLADQWTRWPTPEEIAAALPFTTDPEAAPIVAAAAVAHPDIVLSNDFPAFHSPLAKTFWEQNTMTVESLYGNRVSRPALARANSSPGPRDCRAHSPPAHFRAHDCSSSHKPPPEQPHCYRQASPQLGRLGPGTGQAEDPTVVAFQFRRNPPILLSFACT